MSILGRPPGTPILWPRRFLRNVGYPFYELTPFMEFGASALITSVGVLANPRVIAIHCVTSITTGNTKCVTDGLSLFLGSRTHPTRKIPMVCKTCRFRRSKWKPRNLGMRGLDPVFPGIFLTFPKFAFNIWRQCCRGISANWSCSNSSVVSYFISVTVLFLFALSVRLKGFNCEPSAFRFHWILNGYCDWVIPKRGVFAGGVALFGGRYRGELGTFIFKWSTSGRPNIQWWQ